MPWPRIAKLDTRLKTIPKYESFAAKRAQVFAKNVPLRRALFLFAYISACACYFISFFLSLSLALAICVFVMCVRHRAASELASLALAPCHFILFYMQICEIRGAFHPLSRQLAFKRITCVQIFCQHRTMSLVTFAIERGWGGSDGPRPSSAI